MKKTYRVGVSLVVSLEVCEQEETKEEIEHRVGLKAAYLLTNGNGEYSFVVLPDELPSKEYIPPIPKKVNKKRNG